MHRATYRVILLQNARPPITIVGKLGQSAINIHHVVSAYRGSKRLLLLWV